MKTKIFENGKHQVVLEVEKVDYPANTTMLDFVTEVVVGENETKRMSQLQLFLNPEQMLLLKQVLFSKDNV